MLMFFAAAALAAHCRTLVEPDAWAGQLQVAEDGMSSGVMQRAALAARAVKRDAQCLDGVPTPEQITRLARVEAVVAFHDQARDEVTKWAQLAAATAPDTPWPTGLDASMPSRQLIEGVPGPEAGGSPELVLAIPEGGAAFLNGSWLDRPVFPSSTPNLVQVFDGRGRRLDAWWQEGAKAPAALLAYAGSAGAPKARQMTPVEWLNQARAGTP